MMDQAPEARDLYVQPLDSSESERRANLFY